MSFSLLASHGISGCLSSARTFGGLGPLAFAPDGRVDALVWPTRRASIALVPTPGDRRLGAGVEVLRRRYGYGASFVRDFRDHGLVGLGRLLGRLRGHLSEGSVPLWLLGAVAVRADRAELAELARLPEVHRIETPPAVKPAPIRRLASGSTLDETTGPIFTQDVRLAPGRRRRGIEGVGIALLDTGFSGLEAGLASRFAKTVGFDDLGQSISTSTRGPADAHGHGTQVARTLEATLGHGPIGPRLLAARSLPGGRGTVAQVVAGLQWALENHCGVVVTPLGKSAFHPLWSTVSLALTAAGTSWVVATDSSVHLPVVGAFQRGPLRTRVHVPLATRLESAEGSEIYEGPGIGAARLAGVAATLRALGPTSDPLELARLLWATGECFAPASSAGSRAA